MTPFRLPLLRGVLALALASAASANVIINEVLYHAPNDLSDLEYIELFNTGEKEVALSGWKLSKGVEFKFAKDSVIEPGGFLVVCKDEKLFSRFYEGVKVAGAYKRSLANDSDTVNLKNGDGDIVDSVEYRDEEPWPVSADGYSASLERICPTSGGETAHNWAPSILSDDYDQKPSGTPGKENSVFQNSLPPLIERVGASAEEVCEPGTSLNIWATVKGTEHVALLYRVVEPGKEGEEVSLPMEREGGGRFKATIPAQVAHRIVRFRVRAIGEDGALRYYPTMNEIRPAISVYVSDRAEVGDVPVMHFFNIGDEEFKRGAEYREQARRPSRELGPGGFGRPPGGGPGDFRRRQETGADRARREAERLLRDDALEAAWGTLTLGEELGAGKRDTIRTAFLKAHASLATLREELNSAQDPGKVADRIPDDLAKIGETLRQSCGSALDDDQAKALAQFGAVRRDPGRPGGREFGGEVMLQRFFNIERAWFQIAMNAGVENDPLAMVRVRVLEAIAKRDATELGGGKGGRPDFGAIMEAVDGQRAAFHKALEQDLGQDLFGKLDLERGGFAPGPGGGFGGPGRSARRVPLRPQGLSAFIYTDPDTKTTQLFDFVNIVPRKSGYKVRLHKDRMLDGLATINVLYEADEGTFINEPLAYDLYRAAGNATQRAGYLRLIIDGALVGYHFWFEQANGAFLRHNEIHDEGNLYKVSWQGGGGVSEFTPEEDRPTRRSEVVRRYENKSNPHDGYNDLIELAEALTAAEGDDEKMWNVIETRFDVENVINYFAVNSLLSHWDGFFNNYYLYHDTKRDKWMMFPYDQDSTWSQRMGDVESLSRMPLNFGAADAVRPGGGQGFGFGRPPAPQRDDEQGGPGSRGDTDRPRGPRNERPGGRSGGRGEEARPPGGRGGFGPGGFGWWRDGGEISKPLLANPEFRKRFHARLKVLSETVFTDEDFGARISKAEELLKGEVVLRAKARDADEESAVRNLSEVMNSLRSHLAARRDFVLSELGNGQPDSEREEPLDPK